MNYALQDELKTNDAGVGPDGKLWIGTMQRTPAAPEGSIFSIDNDGEITPQAEHITIPNTFYWNPNGTHCYLTDSYERIIYCPPFSGYIYSLKQHPWQRSGSDAITFDGGVVDQLGSPWVFRWGEGRPHRSIRCDRPITHTVKTSCTTAKQLLLWRRR